MANNDFLTLMKLEPPVPPHRRKKKKNFLSWLLNIDWGAVFIKTMVTFMGVTVFAMIFLYGWAIEGQISNPNKLGEMTLIAEGQGCQTYKVSHYLDTTYFTKCKDVSKVTNKYEVQQGKRKIEITTETLME